MSAKPKHQFILVILFFIYLAFIFYLIFGNTPDGMELPKSIFGIPFDKCVHFSMFLPFPILGTFAFRNKSFWRTFAVFFFIAVVMAFSLEMLQTPLTDGRRATDLWDFVANISGIMTGSLIMIVGGFVKHSK